MNHLVIARSFAEGEDEDNVAISNDALVLDCCHKIATPRSPSALRGSQ